MTKLRDLVYGSTFKTKEGWVYVTTDDWNSERTQRYVFATQGRPSEIGSRVLLDPDTNVEVIEGMICEDMTTRLEELQKGDVFLANRNRYISLDLNPDTNRIEVVDLGNHIITDMSPLAEVSPTGERQEVNPDTPVENDKQQQEALQGLRDRLRDAFGPIGLLDPDGAEELLRDTLDILEGTL